MTFCQFQLSSHIRRWESSQFALVVQIRFLNFSWFGKLANCNHAPSYAPKKTGPATAKRQLSLSVCATSSLSPLSQSSLMHSGLESGRTGLLSACCKGQAWAKGSTPKPFPRPFKLQCPKPNWWLAWGEWDMKTWGGGGEERKEAKRQHAIPPLLPPPPSSPLHSVFWVTEDGGKTGGILPLGWGWQKAAQCRVGAG